MNFLLIIIFLLFFTIYPLLLYPILLIFFSYFRKKKVIKDPFFTPNVSIIVSLHNEGKNIRGLFDSIVSSGYPTEKIQILFGSDGSTDETNKILREIESQYKFVKVFFFERVGKTYVINTLISEASSPFLLLLDADVRLPNGALQEMLIYFADVSVGIVVPEFIQNKTNINQGSNKFSLLKLNNVIRKYESLIYSTVNLLGACYLIRREYFPRIPSQKFCDDFFVALYVNFIGKRVVLVDDVFVYLFQNTSPFLSFFRQRRFVAGGLSAMMYYRKFFHTQPLVTFFLFSGKFLRWLIPANLVIILIILLFVDFFVFQFIFIILSFFGFMTIFDYFFEKKAIKAPKLFSTIAELMFSLTGTFVGFFRAFTKKNNSIW